jgi:hypothetical protein
MNTTTLILILAAVFVIGHVSGVFVALLISRGTINGTLK